MANNLHNNDELREIAPKLFSLKKENPYKVPDGYFDELPMLIQERIGGAEVNPSAWTRIFALIVKPQMAWGSLSIVSLMIIGWLVFQLESKNDLSSQDIAEVIYHGEVDNMDEYLLIEALPEESTFEVQISENATDTKDVMIEYLIENEIDELEIVDELTYI